MTLSTSDPTTNLTQASKASSLANEIEETGPDGILKDIEVLEIDEPIKVSCEARSRDINALFSPPYSTKDGKKVRDCSACTYVLPLLLSSKVADTVSLFVVDLAK